MKTRTQRPMSTLVSLSTLVYLSTPVYLSSIRN